MKFPLEIALPMFPVKFTFGKEKEPVATPAPIPVGASDSELIFDAKDAVIMFLGIALMFTVFAVLVLALAKNSN